MENKSPAILTAPPPIDAPAAPAATEVPFGVNEVRLSARQWLVAISIIIIAMIATPRIWNRVERLETGDDYRIPYSLSNDYALFSRRLEQVADPKRIPVLGDSVIWGEYVSPDGTLPHFLGEQIAQPGRFANCGVNGMFPLAMEGLIEHYARDLRNRKIIVQCNVLWMTSPKADLSTDKEEQFNHSRLVPQWVGRIPCYRADASERLSAIVEQHAGFFQWLTHVQTAYFEQKSVPQWTLKSEGDPPTYPNAWRNPLSQMTLNVPAEPADDPQRGVTSPRHRPWMAEGAEPQRYEWVELGRSLQWAAFRRLLTRLRDRGNDVLVIVGPFNEHMIAAEQRPTYQKMREGVSAWLAQTGIPHIVPETLPSELYADASHPLTEGYKLLARRIGQNETFQKWLGISQAH